MGLIIAFGKFTIDKPVPRISLDTFAVYHDSFPVGNIITIRIFFRDNQDRSYATTYSYAITSGNR